MERLAIGPEWGAVIKLAIVEAVHRRCQPEQTGPPPPFYSFAHVEACSVNPRRLSDGPTLGPWAEAMLK